MSIEENTTRTGWLGNRTKLTIALAVAGALVLGGGAASAAVVSLQAAAAAEAEAERVAAAEYDAAVTEHSELVASGNALVKDLRASLVVGAGLLDQAAIDEASRLVEYLALTLAATTTSDSTADVEAEIDAISAAIDDARGARENVAVLAATTAETRLAAARLAGEQIRQKVTDALAKLAAARESGQGIADALAGLVAAVTAAEASHEAAAAKDAEDKAPTEDKPVTKPQPDKPEKKEEPVDKTDWYTKEEASQAVVSAWGAVPWYSGCEKVGDGYWYRSGGSPSSPPAPPTVSGQLGFKVEIINSEKAWVYYYDCP